jgi:hypothetical protein
MEARDEERRSEMKERKQLLIRLPIDLLDYLTKLGERYGGSKSAEIARCLRKQMEQEMA